MRTVRVGVVGCGGQSDNHLRVYSNTRGVRLVAVCDKDVARARDKGRMFGAENALVDYDSMLKMDLDLVDVVTPTSTHSELSIRALETGHDVLVEKPMALSARECQRMLTAARRNGRTLSVSHNKLFFDSVRQTKALIDRHQLEVGRVSVSLFSREHVRPSWTLDERQGGLLWESLVHHIYLIEHFLGKMESVYATADKVSPRGYDSFTLTLRNRTGTGVSEFELGVKEDLFRIHVVTREGVRFEGDLAHDFIVRRSRSFRGYSILALRSFFDGVYDPFAKWGRHATRAVEMRSYAGAMPVAKSFFTMIRQLISFLRGEESMPPTRAEEGLQAIRVLEAARKSIRTRKAQRIE